MSIYKTGLVLFVASAFGAAVACGGDKTVTVIGAPPDAGPTVDSGATAGDDDDLVGDDDDTTTGTQCTAAAKKLLVPQSKASTGEVKVVSTTDGVSTVYVDASAGGQGQGSKNGRVYLKLDGTKVDLSDVDAAKSSDWDLAFKRVDIFTNGGDGGPGKGAARLVQKAFDTVTAADATGAKQEKFFSGDCEPQMDEGGFLLTTFSGWYDYDDATHIPTPFKDFTFVVKSAAGELYAVSLLAYQGKDDGTLTGGQTGQYVFKVKKL